MARKKKNDKKPLTFSAIKTLSSKSVDLCATFIKAHGSTELSNGTDLLRSPATLLNICTEAKYVGRDIKGRKPITEEDIQRRFLELLPETLTLLEILSTHPSKRKKLGKKQIRWSPQKAHALIQTFQNYKI